MTPTPCALHVGFLLPHPCPNAAVGPCVKCGRSICERHAGLSEAGLLCKSCETGSEASPLAAGALKLAGLALGGVAAAALLSPLFLPRDIEAFEAAGLEDEEDDKFADLS
jgi:hypothetical protein